jgi:hypothetical protein
MRFGLRHFGLNAVHLVVHHFFSFWDVLQGFLLAELYKVFPRDFDHYPIKIFRFGLHKELLTNVDPRKVIFKFLLSDHFYSRLQLQVLAQLSEDRVSSFCVLR